MSLCWVSTLFCMICCFSISILVKLYYTASITIYITFKLLCKCATFLFVLLLLRSAFYRSIETFMNSLQLSRTPLLLYERSPFYANTSGTNDNSVHKSERRLPRCLYPINLLWKYSAFRYTAPLISFKVYFMLQ